jgi:hemerythrin-like domain-containing protein
MTELRARPTPDSGRRRCPVRAWDESDRPTGPAADPDRRYTAREQQAGQRLVAVHDYLRAELDTVRRLMEQVMAGTLPPESARVRLDSMTVSRHNWKLAAYCDGYCKLLTTHHTTEDTRVFPELRRVQPALGPVLDRLEAEHRVVQDLVGRLDAELVGFVNGDRDGSGLSDALDLLTDALFSHLSYEERELVEPLARMWGAEEE